MTTCTTNENWKKSIIKCSKLSKQRRIKNITNYNLNPNICSNCNCNLSYDKRKNKFCSSRCSALSTTKGRKHSESTKRKISLSIKNHEPWNKGSGLVINKSCPICKKPFNAINTSIYCSKKCYIFDQKNGNQFCKVASGGIRHGGGRGKSGRYHGIWCDSTYELVWVIYNIDHNIQFERNWEPFSYQWEGKTHKYYPDFKTDESYIEIKGFLRDHDHAKIQQFPLSLKVLFQKDLKLHFNYVYSEYGKNLVSLYDSNAISKF